MDGGVDTMKVFTKTIVTIISVFGMLFFLSRAYYAGTTHGISMLPTISNGEDVVYYTPFISSNLNGKIIIYSTAGIWDEINASSVCHRVIEDHGDYVICKGDNCAIADPINIPRENIKGEVTAIIPKVVDSGMFLLIIVAMLSPLIAMVIQRVIENEQET
jgi:hypothetical protein